MGLDPVTVATTVMTIASKLGLGTDKKADYKSFDAAAIQVVNTYGIDIVKGSQVLGLDPSQVAQAVSEYLKLSGVNVTPAQVLAQSSSGVVGQVTQMIPYALAAIFGLVILSKFTR